MSKDNNKQYNVILAVPFNEQTVYTKSIEFFSFRVQHTIIRYIAQSL